jgi:hypothetical protein
VWQFIRRRTQRERSGQKTNHAEQLLFAVFHWGCSGFDASGARYSKTWKREGLAFPRLGKARTSAINFAAVAYGANIHDAMRVINAVQHPVITDPDAPQVR